MMISYIQQTNTCTIIPATFFLYNSHNQIFLGSTTKEALTAQDCSLSDKVNRCTALQVTEKKTRSVIELQLDTVGYVTMSHHVPLYSNVARMTGKG
jgi:hypothetical protein